MCPLQEQFRTTGLPKPQTRKSGLTSMGFTSEISPALENLRLGVAVVRGSLYFRGGRVCSAWEEGSWEQQASIFNPSGSKAPRARRDFRNHPLGNGISKQINTFSQVTEPINGWAVTGRKGTNIYTAQTLGPASWQKLPQPPAKQMLIAPFCRGSSGRLSEQADR